MTAIRATRDVAIGREIHPPGTILEVSDERARELIGLGHAVPHVGPVPDAPAEPPPTPAAE